MWGTLQAYGEITGPLAMKDGSFNESELRTMFGELVKPFEFTFLLLDSNIARPRPATEADTPEPIPA